MAQQDVAAQKQESFDLYVMGVIALVIIIVVTMFYYQHPWYWMNLYLYKALSIVPEGIMKYLFFWASDEAVLAKDIHTHLMAHKENYSTYYVAGGSGYKTQNDINLVGFRMFWVFPAIFLGWRFYKELKRNVSPIVPPGGRRRFFGLLAPKKQNALYEYAKSQKEIWPYIKPVVNRMKEMVENPSLDDGWYALSKLPITWILERDLTQKVVTKKVRKIFTRRQKSQFVLSREKTYPVLKENIGPLWKGLDALTFNERCLLAILVPHAFGKTKMSRLINRKICNYHEDDLSDKVKAAMLVDIEKDVNEIISLHSEAFEMPYFIDTEFDEPYDPIASSFEELDSELDMFEKGKELVRSTLLTHAYVKTVMFSLMDKTWTYGVLSSAELLWIKKIDRDLWYVVSQQGRTSSFVEVVGCWSHYLAESTYGFRTLMPQVNEGFRGLDYELYTTHDTYLPHESWDNSAKWDKLVPSFGGANKSSGLSANAGRTL
jgi:hypothetical protein